MAAADAQATGATASYSAVGNASSATVNASNVAPPTNAAKVMISVASRSRAATDAQATDALAAEVLDATDGAFTAVADAIKAGLDAVTPSGFDSFVSTATSIGRKPGFQSALKAPLAMHIQGPATATTKPPPVTPSGSDSNTPSTVDYTVKSARAATSGGVPGT